ncbi:hypothetical protein [Sorangium sp. So ce1335]|uniref:hypothetical protein n=1 Tax=Sorangium sp. So ce1335 TaxID=3133335 RepID=UPI003F5E7B10
MEPTDDIAEFIAYYSVLFSGHPQAGAREGATEDEIEAFARAAGRPLPPLYLGYLREFGHHDGLVELGDDASCDVRAVLRYLQKRAKNGLPSAPPDCVLISIRGVSMSRALHFASPDGPPCVVINDTDTIIMNIASTFKHHLYRQAWVHRWFQGLASVVMSRADYRLVADARPLAESLGFSTQWFSDAFHYYCGERGAARVYCFRGMDRVTLSLLSPDPGELLDLKTHFKEKLQLTG